MKKVSEFDIMNGDASVVTPKEIDFATSVEPPSFEESQGEMVNCFT